MKRTVIPDTYYRQLQIRRNETRNDDNDIRKTVNHIRKQAKKGQPNQEKAADVTARQKEKAE